MNDLHYHLDEWQLLRVDYALEKLCKAYASERISQTLYRRQREALIDVLQYPELPFPHLILNEFAQDCEDLEVIHASHTKVENRFEVELTAPQFIQDHEPLEEMQAPLSHFDRFYFWYLSVFLTFIGVYVYFNE